VVLLVAISMLIRK